MHPSTAPCIPMGSLAMLAGLTMAGYKLAMHGNGMVDGGHLLAKAGRVLGSCTVGLSPRPATMQAGRGS
jgi:hypothetical protein